MQLSMVNTDISKEIASSIINADEMKEYYMDPKHGEHMNFRNVDKASRPRNLEFSCVTFGGPQM